MKSLTFEGATVYLPGRIEETSVTIADGKIVEIGGPVQDEVIDARGRILAPALIDVHGDAFERQVMPRPGVFFPMKTALLDTDRQLAANGIATAYHAVTLGWEPGLRSVDRGRGMIEALAGLAPRLTVENRVQLRWETFAFEAIDLIEQSLQGPLLPSLAFNDHTSMKLRAFDIPVQERPFEHSDAFEVADMEDVRMAQRIESEAKRSGLSVPEYLAQLVHIWERRAEVPAMISRLAKAGQKAGVPMLSHDDTRAETRRFYRQRGATVAEFPMVLESTEAARAAGDHIIFGAPNVVRGGSHIGSLAASDMVEAGLCDALASDYFYPAMLAAVAQLAAEQRAERPALWSLVSAGPARAMNLHDRGEIAEGKRADLVLVDWPEGDTPAITATWSAGRQAYSSQAAARSSDM